jgi:uncharacterized protein
MIIDADVHISPFAETDRIQIDELLRRMDRARVDKALTWLQPHYFRDVDLGNRYVFEACRKFPERILGFGWADPHHGLDAAINTAHRCLDEYGFFGVKLNGAQNEFFIDQEDLSIPIVEEIARRGKVVAFHIGTDAYETTHPFRLGKIAKLFPQTKFLAVHMGGVAHRDLTNAMIEIAHQHLNITLIGSAVKTKAIIKAIQVLGPERVCFGSDTPFDLMHVELARYQAMLEDVLTAEDKSLVLGGNIARLLAIPLD